MSPSSVCIGSTHATSQIVPSSCDGVFLVKFRARTPTSGPLKGLSCAGSCMTLASSPRGVGKSGLALHAAGSGQETGQQRQALARVLVARGRTAEALAALEPLLRDAPACADLLCMRGNCLAAAGNNVGVSYGSVSLPAVRYAVRSRPNDGKIVMAWGGVAPRVLPCIPGGRSLLSCLHCCDRLL